MAEKEFKIQNGLRVLEEAYLESSLDVGGTVTATAFSGNGSGLTGISSYTAPTLGSTLISSGATVTTIAGLTLSNTTFNVETTEIVPAYDQLWLMADLLIYPALGNANKVYIDGTTLLTPSSFDGNSVVLTNKQATISSPSGLSGYTFTANQIFLDNSTSNIELTLNNPTTESTAALSSWASTSQYQEVRVSWEAGTQSQATTVSISSSELLNIPGAPKTVMCINFGNDDFATYTIDGSSWFKTATSNGNAYMRPYPHNMASSGDTTIIYASNINTPGNNDVVLLVYKNFYDTNTATLVASFTKSEIASIASAGNVSNLAISGLIANENGTFVIPFMNGPKFLVSTDYGLTWSLSNSITAPAGGEGEGEGGAWYGFYYYPSYSSVTNKFYVKGFSAAGYLSSSDGITWTTTNVPNSSSGDYPIFVDAQGNIVAGHGFSGVAYSTNGGTSWSYGYDQDFLYSTNHVMVGSIIYFNNYGTIKAISINGLARGDNSMYWNTHQNLGQGGIQYYMQSKDKVMYSGNGTFATVGTADATNVMQFGYPRTMAYTYTSTVNARALTVPAAVYNKMIGA